MNIYRKWILISIIILTMYMLTSKTYIGKFRLHANVVSYTPVIDKNRITVDNIKYAEVFLADSSGNTTKLNTDRSTIIDGKGNYTIIINSIN